MDFDGAAVFRGFCHLVLRFWIRQTHGCDETARRSLSSRRGPKPRGPPEPRSLGFFFRHHPTVHHLEEEDPVGFSPSASAAISLHARRPPLTSPSDPCILASCRTPRSPSSPFAVSYTSHPLLAAMSAPCHCDTPLRRALSCAVRHARPLCFDSDTPPPQALSTCVNGRGGHVSNRRLI